MHLQQVQDQCLDQWQQQKKHQKLVYARLQDLAEVYQAAAMNGQAVQ